MEIGEQTKGASMRRVQANKIYRYGPVGMDIYDCRNDAEPGQPVKVVALPGCPKPNTMGHCHIQRYRPIEDKWVFAGLVLCASLKPWKLNRSKI